MWGLRLIVFWKSSHLTSAMLTVRQLSVVRKVADDECEGSGVFGRGVGCGARARGRD